MPYGNNSVTTTSGATHVTQNPNGPYFAIKRYLPAYDHRIDTNVHADIGTSVNTSAIEVSASWSEADTYENLVSSGIVEIIYDVGTSATYSYDESNEYFLILNDGDGTAITSTTVTGSKQKTYQAVNLYNGSSISDIISADSLLVVDSDDGDYTGTSITSATGVGNGLPGIFSNLREATFDIIGYSPITSGGSTARGLFKLRLNSTVGDFKFNKILLFVEKYTSSGEVDTSFTPVLFAEVAFNTVIKYKTGYGITNFSLDVELEHEPDNFSSNITYLNTDYWTKIPETSVSANDHGLNYTGDVIIGTSADSMSWNPGAKLELVEQTNSQLRLSYDTSATYTDLKTLSTGEFNINKNVSSGGVSLGSSVSATGQSSFATGQNNIASNVAAVVFGVSTSATAQFSFAGGAQSKASGISSMAYGNGASATQLYSIALGDSVLSTGQASISIGEDNIASGRASVALNALTESNGDYSLATGYNTSADGDYSFAGGKGSRATNLYSMVYGLNANNYGIYSALFGMETYIDTGTSGNFGSGYQTSAYGDYGAVFGYQTVAQNNYAFAGGYGTSAVANYSFSYGEDCISNSSWATSFGLRTSATSNYAFAIGRDNIAKDVGTFVGGFGSIADSDYGFAFGRSTSATGTEHSISIGDNTLASNSHTFAGGELSKATGQYGFTWGYATSAVGTGSVSFGHQSEANGNYSVSIGYQNDAIAIYSIAMGYSNIADGTGSVVLGYDNESGSNYSFVLGRRNTTTSTFTNAYSIGYMNSCYGNDTYIFGTGNTFGGSSSNSMILGENTFGLGQHSVYIGAGASLKFPSDNSKVVLYGDAGTKIYNGLNVSSGITVTTGGIIIQGGQLQIVGGGVQIANGHSFFEYGQAAYAMGSGKTIANPFTIIAYSGGTAGDFTDNNQYITVTVIGKMAFIKGRLDIQMVSGTSDRIKLSLKSTSIWTSNRNLEYGLGLSYVGNAVRVDEDDWVGDWEYSLVSNRKRLTVLTDNIEQDVFWLVPTEAGDVLTTNRSDIFFEISYLLS